MPKNRNCFVSLGVPTGIALVVGAAIGSGIFVKPGTIASHMGDVRLILLAWVLRMLALFGGLCFAELAAMLPRAGGLYAYLREAYGPLIGFLFGWNDVLFNRPAARRLSVVFWVRSREPLVGSPEALLERWPRRHLSLRGRD